MEPPTTQTASFSTQTLTLHPKLKQLLICTLNGRRPPKNLFDETSYRYFSTYVKPKITAALKAEYPIIRIYISPNYLVYNIGVHYKQHQRTYFYTYIFGVDNDRIFVNRIHGAPAADDEEIIILRGFIELRLTTDEVMYRIMDFDINLADQEETIIESITQDRPVNIRVQGDLVLQIEPLNNNSLIHYLHPEGITQHITTLMTDLINRILLSYGLSPETTNTTIHLFNVAPRSNDVSYLEKIALLVYKELKELLGSQEVEIITDMHQTHYELRINSKYNCTAWVETVGGGLNNPYNHIRIRTTCNSILNRPPYEPAPLFTELRDEIIEAINNTPPTNFEFSIGNHYVKLTNTKSLSFSYRPSKQPITLNEHTINIINPLTFITTPNTTIELHHPEHGIKTIRFRNSYIIRFMHVRVHDNYIAERNRTIIRNLKIEAKDVTIRSPGP
jgi:hypothetical protein